VSGKDNSPVERVYKTAIYMRLSREDEQDDKSGSGGESDSIKNQRDLLTAYVKTRADLTLVSTFCDDGYSGYDFDRPSFTNMIAAAKKGEIDCIVVKDLSRLGRNFVKVEEYTQIIFPNLKIRFIALGNDIDTIRAKSFNELLAAPIINIANAGFGVSPN
jgi:DNA invertase Pin-like site-specific DNA recombinase